MIEEVLASLKFISLLGFNLAAREDFDSKESFLPLQKAVERFQSLLFILLCFKVIYFITLLFFNLLVFVVLLYFITVSFLLFSFILFFLKFFLVFSQVIDIPQYYSESFPYLVAHFLIVSEAIHFAPEA
jgi:hypothetical protein